MGDVSHKDIATSVKDIPDHYVGMVIHFFMHFHNDTTDFKTPHLRPSLKNSFPLYLILYGLVGALGLFLNANMLRRIFLFREHCENIDKYLASNAVNDMFKCIVVMPVSLAILALQNWIFGSFLCHFLPIAQDVPFYATFLTLLATAFDRYRTIMNPLKTRNSAGFWLLGTWVTSFLVALPYSVYSEYVDLEKYFGQQFKGVGICVVNVENNIEEFIRALFIVLYATPAVLIVYLHLKVTVEINNRKSLFSTSGQRSPTLLNFEENTVSSVATSSVTGIRESSFIPIHVGNSEIAEAYNSDVTSHSLAPGLQRYHRRHEDEEFDWEKEKVIQNSFFIMAFAYALCLFPLHVTRLVKHVVAETMEHSAHFDLAFINVVLIALLPTITTPVIYRSMYPRGVFRGDLSNYLSLQKQSSALSLQPMGSDCHNIAYHTSLSPAKGD
ncbi:neuropeptide Y receptor type 6-like [Limulus polyphemus]|uniref:Neuropeptide Y receptor type 6-like n=1 Tax=Limulus polyphemus TaxID=6850 RepID=A0ABM1BI05_LIMPO|nr:neuropeptide Y receptor type 6-like [Limulus polyphemus]